jgi:hypothetical protein
MSSGHNVTIDYFEAIEANGPSYTYLEVAKIFEMQRKRIVEEYHLLSPLMNSPKLSTITELQQNETDPFWQNGFFQCGDARAAYALAVTLNPAHIIEIGSGNSTKFFRRAILDYGLRSKIVSIDPTPRADISKIADTVIPLNAVKVPVSCFDELRAGDILFIDGSHYCFNGSDVTHLFLNVLPRLPLGVVVHIHDIMLPYEYMDVFTKRNYNEQYLLAALLFNTARWQITLPLSWLSRQGITPPEHVGVSFWMRVI